MGTFDIDNSSPLVESKNNSKMCAFSHTKKLLPYTHKEPFFRTICVCVCVCNNIRSIISI